MYNEGSAKMLPSLANGCCIFPNYKKFFIKQGLICRTSYKC